MRPDSHASASACPFDSSFGAVMTSPHHTQAHLTIAFGDGVHVCAAAVLAENLRRVDPRRRRVAFGWRLSREARAILSYGWEVREVPEPAGGSRGRTSVVLDARVHASKPALLSRALYWDTDHFPLRSAARHIEALWAVHPETRMVASPESRGCFNGGLLLFRPSEERRSEFERLVALGPQMAPRTCAAQRDLGVDDQRFVNAVFKEEPSVVVKRLRGLGDVNDSATASNHTWYRPLPFATFAVRTPHNFLGRMTNLDARHDCQRTPALLERLADSYHFYGRTPPWGADCAECVMRGLPCNVELARSAALPRPACAYFAAQSLWWAAFAQLPAWLRGKCFERLRDTTAIDASARAKLGRERGEGTGAKAGCNLSDTAHASDDLDAFDWQRKKGS